MFRALRHRNFRLFIMGQLVSLTGTWMQSVAQGWLVYRLTHSELLLGATAFCGSIPIFLLAPLGGLAADRYSRRRIVVAAQTCSMLQALALAVLTLTGAVQVWHVLALAVGLGIVNAFDMPARQALFVHMTGKEDLMGAISLNSAMFNMARVVGPSVAGFVVAALGEGACFLLNSLSFLAVIASLLAMRLREKRRAAPDSPWAHLVDGFRYARRTPPLRVLLGASGAINFCGAPAMVLAPVFADTFFHRGSSGLGLLTGAMGLGAVAGALGLAARGSVAGLTRLIPLSQMLMGAGMAVFAWADSFYLALAAMPLIGLGVMRQNTASNTLIQTNIPDDYRGRIMALYAMMAVGMTPLGSLAAGGLAEHAGARWTVFAGGLLCLATATLFHWRRAVFHDWREVRHPE